MNIFHKITSLFIKSRFKNLDFPAVESTIGYRFKDRSLLLKAFTHSSYLSISGGKSYDSNERLEFFGDAVLGMVICQILFEQFPGYLEGDLTKVKSVLVSAAEPGAS